MSHEQSCVIHFSASMWKLFKAVNPAFPIWDFTYILQLEEYTTKRYLDKVRSKNEQDNCKKEFNYAEITKGGQFMVSVIMDPEVGHPSLGNENWRGPATMVSMGIGLEALYRLFG